MHGSGREKAAGVVPPPTVPATMPASHNTPPMGKEGSGSQTRRQFLGAAATAAALAAGEVPSDNSDRTDRLVELAERDDTDRWEYETAANMGFVNAGLAYGELSPSEENPSGNVQTRAVDDDGIPLDVGVTHEDQELGALVHLSADDAEALAVDLLEQARAAREYEGEAER